MAEAGGLDAVTWRGLARRLGVDPMSLYRHVDGRDALLDAVTEFLLAGMEIPAATGRFAADVAALAAAFRTAAVRYPNCAPLMLTRQLGSPSALAPIEHMLAAGRAAGLSPADAVHILRTVSAYVIGTLLREVGFAPTLGDGATDGSQRRRAELTDAGLPHVAEAAPHLATMNHQAEFDHGLDLIITAVAIRHGIPTERL